MYGVAHAFPSKKEKRTGTRGKPEICNLNSVALVPNTVTTWMIFSECYRSLYSFKYSVVIVEEVLTSAWETVFVCARNEHRELRCRKEEH
jgi:hypothetical protein